LLEAAEANVAELPLDFLLRIMRDKTKRQAVRLDAAGKACPFVYPRLSAVVIREDKPEDEDIVVEFGKHGRAKSKML
jgi:hypothetical protein